MSGCKTQIETERRLTDELAVAKDDKETDPDRLSETDETMIKLDGVVSTVSLPLDIFKTNPSNTVNGVVWDGDEKPYGAGDGKEDGGEEETVIVSKF